MASKVRQSRDLGLLEQEMRLAVHVMSVAGQSLTNRWSTGH